MPDRDIQSTSSHAKPSSNTQPFPSNAIRTSSVTDQPLIIHLPNIPLNQDDHEAARPASISRSLVQPLPHNSSSKPFFSVTPAHSKAVSTPPSSRKPHSRHLQPSSSSRAGRSVPLSASGGSGGSTYGLHLTPHSLGASGGGGFGGSGGGGSGGLGQSGYLSTSSYALHQASQGSSGHSMVYRGFGAERPQIWTKSLTRHTAPGASSVLGRPTSWIAPDGQYGLGAGVLGQGGTSRPLMNPSASRMGGIAMMSTEANINEFGSNILSPHSLSVPQPRMQFLTSSDAGGDNVSVLSRSLREKLKELGHPLRGPIMAQMATHYLSFLLLLWIAYQTEWSANMRFYMAYFYFHIAVFILQISRMAYAKNPNSVVPFYISLAPFALLVIISREARMIVMVLWYVSFLIIYLQSGHHDMGRHLIYYSIAFICVYYLCVVTMFFFYTSDCSEVYCGVGFAEGEGINFAFEAVLCGACGMVVICFVMLERFIKLNASTLLERDNYMNQLYHANIDLKRQLRRAKSEKEVDLEAPLARATQILREVKETQELNKSVQDEIDFIMGILASDQLYNPNLYQKPGDADVHDWLNNMLLTQRESAAGTAGRSMGQTSKQVSVRSDVSGSGTGLGVASHPGADNILQKTDLAMFALLEDMDNPNYDVAELARASGGRELYYIGWYIFRRYDFFEQHQINEFKFRHWLTKVESGYRGSNPYHNATHAADVTHVMHYYISRPRLWNVLQPEEQLASIIAPIIHDYMHPGVNNAFLIATLNPLAIRYNDQAVLEHFHCSSIFELFQNPEYDILSSLSPETRKTVREFVISMVMATDMSQHFDWIGKFKTKLTGIGFNFENKPDRKMVLNVAIKCADINNPAKPLDGCRRWTEMIMEEFFMQGEEEKRKGVPVSPMMDREKTDIPKCQIGFIDFIILPLFEAWSGFMLEDLDPFMANIHNNKAYWKAQAESNALQGSFGRTPSNTTPSDVGSRTGLTTLPSLEAVRRDSIGRASQRSGSGMRPDGSLLKSSGSQGGMGSGTVGTTAVLEAEGGGGAGTLRESSGSKSSVKNLTGTPSKLGMGSRSSLGSQGHMTLPQNRSSGGHSHMAQESRGEATEETQEAGNSEEEADPSPTDSAPPSSPDAGVTLITEQSSSIPTAEHPSPPVLQAPPESSILSPPAAKSTFGAFRLPPLTNTSGEGAEESLEDSIITIRRKAPAGPVVGEEWRDLESGEERKGEETQQQED